MRVWIVTEDSADNDIVGVYADPDTAQRLIAVATPDCDIVWSSDGYGGYTSYGIHKSTNFRGWPNYSLCSYDVVTA